MPALHRECNILLDIGRSGRWFDPIGSCSVAKNGKECYKKSITNLIPQFPKLEYGNKESTLWPSHLCKMEGLLVCFTWETLHCSKLFP